MTASFDPQKAARKNSVPTADVGKSAVSPTVGGRLPSTTSNQAVHELQAGGSGAPSTASLLASTGVGLSPRTTSNQVLQELQTGASPQKAPNAGGPTPRGPGAMVEQALDQQVEEI